MDLLDKMATYVRVIEAGSFSAAARQLRISSAAVSRQIATLEAELGVTLLARSTRRMAVTANGRQYYEQCLRVLREVDKAQLVGRGALVDGLIQLNAPVTFGLARIVPHLHGFMKSHPGVRVDLRLEDRLVDLALEGVDVAIRVGSPTSASADLVARELLVYRRILVASPVYLKRHGEPASPEALAKHDTLAHVAGMPTDTWTLTCAGREARVRLNIAFRCNALHAVRELAVTGAGVALLPEWFVVDQVRRRALRVVLPGWQTEPVTVSALYRLQLRGSPRVRALIAHLQAAYGAGNGERSIPVAAS